MRNPFEQKVAGIVGKGFDYEAIKLPYVIQHTYTPDWVNVSTKTIIEAKGYFPPVDRKKMLAVRQQYPDWTITIVFQNPQTKISKKSKTTYAAWCDRHGIAWLKA